MGFFFDFCCGKSLDNTFTLLQFGIGEVECLQ